MFRGTGFWGVTKLTRFALITVFLVLACSSAAMAEPSIPVVSPANLSQLDQVTQVTATVYGATTISTLTLDGQAVTGTLAGNSVVYQGQFAPGLHVVYLAVVDGTGATAERTWQFYVNDPLQTLLLPDNPACTKCHTSTFQNYPGHMIDLRSPEVTHPDECAACHYTSRNRTNTINVSGVLVVRPDGSEVATGCTECHIFHWGLYSPPPHGNTDWKGNWDNTNLTIKAPRASLDCQYCHQPSTKARLGHDLAADHQVVEEECTGCHGGLMTVIHNKNGLTCATCHDSTDPVVGAVVKNPMVANAGNLFRATATSSTSGRVVESYVYQIYNDLNLMSVSLVVYGGTTEVVSPAWDPGEGLTIKRVKVDNWSTADKQYILAYVASEGKWYTISVQDEGKFLYGRDVVGSPAKEIYLPAGTTSIKTKLIAGPGDSTYKATFNVTQAYYNKPAKCTDCHDPDIHKDAHRIDMDPACLNCHQNDLAAEHLNNPITQYQYNLNTCDICHRSTNPVILGAIKVGNRQCAACHKAAHSVKLTQTVPLDVVRYPDLQWSLPASISTWSGESWIPLELPAVSQVITSNASQALTPQAVQDYYNTNMTMLQWTLNSTVGGSDYLQLKYTKEKRTVYVFWYSGPVPNTVTPGSQSYRLTIIYN